MRGGQGREKVGSVYKHVILVAGSEVCINRLAYTCSTSNVQLHAGKIVALAALITAVLDLVPEPDWPIIAAIYLHHDDRGCRSFQYIAILTLAGTCVTGP